MKKLFVILFALVLAVGVNAQTLTVKQFQESAMALMQQGDFTNAMVALEKAKAIEPNNLETIKNISFCFYLQREFAQAIDAGKIAIELPNADQQSFQILGMSYKSIADYSAANKIYKRALKKFPDGGVIYSEYGKAYCKKTKKTKPLLLGKKG
jgi:tetratricopeptide (TPR) repeat protein